MNADLQILLNAFQRRIPQEEVNLRARMQVLFGCYSPGDHDFYYFWDLLKDLLIHRADLNYYRCHRDWRLEVGILWHQLEGYFPEKNLANWDEDGF